MYMFAEEAIAKNAISFTTMCSTAFGRLKIGLRELA